MADWVNPRGAAWDLSVARRGTCPHHGVGLLRALARDLVVSPRGTYLCRGLHQALQGVGRGVCTRGRKGLGHCFVVQARAATVDGTPVLG